MERILEPEVMDSMEETIAYDGMDFTEINTAFAKDAITLCPLESADSSKNAVSLGINVNIVVL